MSPLKAVIESMKEHNHHPDDLLESLWKTASSAGITAQADFLQHFMEVHSYDHPKRIPDYVPAGIEKVLSNHYTHPLPSQFFRAMCPWLSTLTIREIIKKYWHMLEDTSDDHTAAALAKFATAMARYEDARHFIEKIKNDYTRNNTLAEFGQTLAKVRPHEAWDIQRDLAPIPSRIRYARNVYPNVAENLNAHGVYEAAQLMTADHNFMETGLRHLLHTTPISQWLRPLTEEALHDP